MQKSAAEQLVTELYKHALNRKPDEVEYRKWVYTAMYELSPENVVSAFYSCDEYRAKNAIDSIFPNGHFHSPVVDPSSVGDYVLRERLIYPARIPGVSLDAAAMRQLWLENLDFIRTTPFTDDVSPKNRYNYLGGPFPPGDAITLRMIIRHFRPQRIVEVGSGYSTACMLDSAEHADIPGVKITCVEPDPSRLKTLLREQDAGALQLIERPVQEVPPDIVDCLEKNDILFIDSTHVMKTGSDVHYEFFHLLPRLNPGVLVHFHDIIWPFEYPDEWIFESNYSWNETYVLRAFLMFNTEFRVVFWNSFFANSFADSIRTEYPDFLRNPGGSMWIARVDSR